MLPLLPHLDTGTIFTEPCAGKLDLVRHLEGHGHSCIGTFDTHPGEGITIRDAASVWAPYDGVFITNPPWNRKILHPIIESLSAAAPTWLLFDADWAHTKQARPYLKGCRKIVSVGRVKWFGNMTGKDNCCWYLFGDGEKTEFINEGVDSL